MQNRRRLIKQVSKINDSQREELLTMIANNARKTNVEIVKIVNKRRRNMRRGMHQDPVLMPLTGVVAEKFMQQINSMEKADLTAMKLEGEQLYKQISEMGIVRRR